MSRLTVLIALALVAASCGDSGEAAPRGPGFYSGRDDCIDHDRRSHDDDGCPGTDPSNGDRVERFRIGLQRGHRRHRGC